MCVLVLTPLTLSYLALSYAAVTAYCRVVLQIDEADYGGSWELHKEGFMAGFATFLVCALLCDRLIHVPFSVGVDHDLYRPARITKGLTRITCIERSA